MWKYILIGIAIITLITVISVLMTKKSTNNSCTEPDTNSCSAWVNGTGVSSASKPCVNGTIQSCNTPGAEQPGGSSCESDGCFVVCNGGLYPDSQSKTCIPYKPQHCNFNSEGNTVITCQCLESANNKNSCTHFKASYYNTTTNTNDTMDTSQGNIDALCSIGNNGNTIKYPTNWTNSNSDDNGTQTTLQRTCTSDSYWTDNKYDNFTCPVNYSPNTDTYSCDYGTQNRCDNDGTNSCGYTGINVNGACDPTQISPLLWCGGITGSTECLIKDDSFNYKGRRKCENNYLSPVCTPCCAPGWYFDKISNTCEKIPMGYTVGFENGVVDATGEKSWEQVLVRMAPAECRSDQLHDNFCNNAMPAGDRININTPNSNISRNAGYVVACEGIVVPYTSYTDMMIIRPGAYYKNVTTNTWEKCGKATGCTDTTGTTLVCDINDTPGCINSNFPGCISLIDPKLTQYVSIKPNDIGAEFANPSQMTSNSIFCSTYNNTNCPVWCATGPNNTCLFDSSRKDECNMVGSALVSLDYDNTIRVCPHPDCGMRSGSEVCVNCNSNSGDPNNCVSGCNTQPGYNTNGTCGGCGQIPLTANGACKFDFSCFDDGTCNFCTAAYGTSTNDNKPGACLATNSGQFI